MLEQLYQEKTDFGKTINKITFLLKANYKLRFISLYFIKIFYQQIISIICYRLYAIDYML